MKLKSQMTINLVVVAKQIIRSVFDDHVVAGVICHAIRWRRCHSVARSRWGGVGTSWGCQIIEVCFRRLSTLVGASSSHGMQVQFQKVLRGATFLSRVVVATTLCTSWWLVFWLRVFAFALRTSRITGSLALVFAFRGSMIAILVGILWCLFLSICMYFRHGLGRPWLEFQMRSSLCLSARSNVLMGLE